MMVVCCSTETLFQRARLCKEPDMTSDNVHDEILRRMTPQQKLEAAARLYVAARQFKRASLVHFHPDWTAEQIDKALAGSFNSCR